MTGGVGDCCALGSNVAEWAAAIRSGPLLYGVRVRGKNKASPNALAMQ